MSGQSHRTKTARKLEKLYSTKAHDVKHQTIMRLLEDRGLDGTINQLEAWGLRPCTGTSPEDPQSSSRGAGCNRSSEGG
jgi:hypothetical protein